jgi:peptidoglycan/LPS O-acetylase OafA/YrhL
MKLNYRPEIDGLRAVAVLSVILYHAEFELFGGGFVGVDVFFVISGYLITSIIVNELQEGKFSLVNFYERRIRRIFPALFVVILSCMVFAWLWYLPNDFKDYAQSQVAVSMFASNLLFWRQSGYFDSANELKPLLHTWSLAVEEQFYLFYPVGLLLVFRYFKRWMSPIIVFVAFLSFGFAQWASYRRPTLAFYFLPARIWELLVGALAAIVLINRQEKRTHLVLREICACLGLFLIAYSVFAFKSSTPFPGMFALVPTVGAALIIMFGERDTFIGRLLSLKTLVGIGLASYSAYLWHQPVFAFARYQGFQTQLSYMPILLLAITFGLAYLSWKYIETPFRIRRSLTRGKVFILGAMLSVLLMATGLQINASNGIESRFKTNLIGDVGQLDFHRYLTDNFFDCEPKSVAAEALSWEGYLRCKQSKAGIPDVVLLGDSHAEHLFIGLAEARPDLNVAFYISFGAPLTENDNFAAIFEELLSNRKSQHVVIALAYRLQISSDNQNEVLKALELTIDRLQNSKKTVSLLGDVPIFPVSSEFCKFGHRKAKNLDLCNVTVNQVTEQRSDFLLEIKDLSKRQNIGYFEIDQPLCDVKTCGMIKDGQVLYRDDNHLNILGSKLVGGYVASLINF